MSALKFAYGLVGDWSKVCVIDSEAHRAEMYSHLGEYLHYPIEAPFTPEKYVHAIHDVENARKEDGTPYGIQVIIIDSISHEWEGEGGCLEMMDDAKKNVKNQMSPWSVITPRHNKFIEAIKQSPCHILATARSKIDHYLYMEENKKGKASVEKVPMKIISREGFEYEMTLAFTLYQNHYAVIDKDNTGIFNESPFMIDYKTGAKVKEWNESGAYNPLKWRPKETTIDQIISFIAAHTANFKNEVELKKIYKELGVSDPRQIRTADELMQSDWLDYLKERKLPAQAESLAI